MPAWGFGVVTESTTEIPLGKLLWGFWPTASFPVSLRLQTSGLKGSWTEISESRQRLMTVYNVYSEEGRIDPLISPSERRAGTICRHSSTKMPYRVWRGHPSSVQLGKRDIFSAGTPLPRTRHPGHQFTRWASISPSQPPTRICLRPS